jgi:hypothetical protein
MLSLYSLLEASLLLINAVAVLNRERFLHRYFASSSNSFESSSGAAPSAKTQLVNLVFAVQTVMRGEE